MKKDKKKPQKESPAMKAALEAVANIKSKDPVVIKNPKPDTKH